MYLVWEKGTLGPTAYKCTDLPTDGHGAAPPYIAKFELKPDEADGLIRDLEKRYPLPT